MTAGHKFVKYFEEAKNFDEALVTIVRIVEKEGLKAPTVNIMPVWAYEEDMAVPPEIRFEIEISASFDTETNEEVTDPAKYS